MVMFWTLYSMCLCVVFDGIGAAHTVLAGYWAKQLGKDRLYGKMAHIRH